MVKDGNAVSSIETLANRGLSDLVEPLRFLHGTVFALQSIRFQ